MKFRLNRQIQLFYNAKELYDSLSTSLTEQCLWGLEQHLLNEANQLLKIRQVLLSQGKPVPDWFRNLNSTVIEKFFYDNELRERMNLHGMICLPDVRIALTGVSLQNVRFRETSPCSMTFDIHGYLLSAGFGFAKNELCYRLANVVQYRVDDAGNFTASVGNINKHLVEDGLSAMTGELLDAEGQRMEEDDRTLDIFG